MFVFKVGISTDKIVHEREEKEKKEKNCHSVQFSSEMFVYCRIDSTDKSPLLRIPTAKATVVQDKKEAKRKKSEIYYRERERGRERERRERREREPERERERERERGREGERERETSHRSCMCTWQHRYLANPRCMSHSTRQGLCDISMMRNIKGQQQSSSPSSNRFIEHDVSTRKLGSSSGIRPSFLKQTHLYF